MTVDPDALAAYLAGALDWDLERARSLAGDAIRQAEPNATPPQPRERDRLWIGEARAAFDQSLAALPSGDFGDPAYWLQRTQAAAAIAAAEQAHIANLIAWKQLAATRQAAQDQGVGMLPLGDRGDAVTVEIEHGLGIA